MPGTVYGGKTQSRNMCVCTCTTLLLVLLGLCIFTSVQNRTCAVRLGGADVRVKVGIGAAHTPDGIIIFIGLYRFLLIRT